MKLFIAILQILLGLHTAMGAVWKLMNPSALIPLFPTLPEGAFIAISLVELIAAALLLLPFVVKSVRGYGWIGAAIIAIEMAGFIALYLSTGSQNYSQTHYWVVVLLVGAFITYMRTAVKPATPTA